MHKSITNIKYNHINQATEVDFGIKKTKYIYTATGIKLQTQIFEGTQLKTKTDYSGAYVYVNNVLSYTNIQGGRIVNSQTEGTNNNDVFQYNLTDHLGNVRVTFEKGADGKAKIIQEDHYYPFGMRMSGQHYDNKSLINKYLYNGKEQQEQTNYYDYGFRQLDPQLGRWHVVDAMAEKYMSYSPYAYVGNDPVNKIDLLGLKWWRAPEHAYIGTTYSGGTNIWSFLHNFDFNGTFDDAGGGGGNGDGASRHWGSNDPQTAAFDEYWNSTTQNERNTLSFGEWYSKKRRLDFKNGSFIGDNGLTPIYGSSWAGSGKELTFKGLYTKGYKWTNNSAGKGNGDPPHGGVMFYNESGSPLYVSGLGKENIIYTVSSGDVSNFQNSLNVLNPKSSPLTLQNAQLLADVYGTNSYTPYGVNETYVLGNINAPWYIYALASLTIMGEAYNSGRYSGPISNSYSVSNFWKGYFYSKKFEPWW